MKIEGNIRVAKSPHGTEVFIQSVEPLANFVLHLPADAKVADGESIEFVQKVDRPLTKKEAEAAEAALPGKIAAVS